VKFAATKKGIKTNFFHPSLLFLFLDPGWVKIRIQDKHPGSATLVKKGKNCVEKKLTILTLF
jgi:hypothetical protein